MFGWNRTCAALVLAALCAGCPPDEPEPDVRDYDSLAEKQELDAALDYFVSEGAVYTLESSAWRNMMPGGNNDSGLMVSARLKDAVGGSAPDRYSIVQVYTIRGSQVWVAGLDEGGTARNGPYWGSDAFVDIAVSVYDSVASQTVYVKNLNQHIVMAE